MNKIKRCLFVFLLIIVIMVPAIPVQADNEGKKVITVSSNIGEEMMESYIEAFEKKYPDIIVNYIYYSDYENDMKAKIEEGDYGDVLCIPGSLGSDQFKKYLEPLGNYSELSEIYNYMDGCKRVEEDVYGIPSSAYANGIVYNKDVFNQAGITTLPTTIEEFISDLQMIQERTDAIPFYTNYSSLWTLQFWEEFSYLEMTGDPDYKWNKFIYERNPFSKGSSHYQVYKMLYDIVSQGLCEEDPSSDDWETSKGMLNRGEIACMALGSWSVSQIKQAGGNGDAVSFMPFPNAIDGKQYMTISTDYCYAINKNSEQKEAARAYIDFMLNESNYALDHETLSLLKTDPYPKVYGDMDNVILASNNAATTVNSGRYAALSANLNMTDNTQTARVIEAAAGYSDETFDEIIDDWNEKWESGRPQDMEKEMTDSVGSRLQSSVVSGDYEVDLSDTEKEFLKDLETVKVGYLKQFAPFQYEREGAASGLSIDICEIMSDTVGMKMEYVPFDNQKDLIQAVKDGTVMIAAGLDRNDVQEEALRFSMDYMDYTNVLAKSDSISVEQLDEKTEAVVAGSAIKSGEREGTRIEKKDIRQAISAVEQGRADFVIGNYYSIDYYIKDLETEHVSVVPMSDAGMISFVFSADTDTRLISVCNKCLYSIPDNQFQVLLMDDLDPPAKAITIARYISANPVRSAVVIVGIIAVIAGAIMIFLKQRLESERKHKLDVKRYETLAVLTDEYVFEYRKTKNQIHFDHKFLRKFGIEGKISVEEYRHSNACLGAMLDVLEKIEWTDCTGGYESEPFEIATDSGKEWYRMTIYQICEEQSKESHLIGKLVNVQKEVEQQMAIKNMAERDALTGLLNRAGFAAWYQKLTAQENIMFAVMDFDFFKQVNDTMGHAGGDEALKLLANTLREIFTKNAGLCRYGGDEFILCVYDTAQEEIAEKLQMLIKRMDCDMEYQGLHKHISISLGAVTVTSKYSQEELFKQADAVLYEVKEHGKNNWHLKNIN